MIKWQYVVFDFYVSICWTGTITFLAHIYISDDQYQIEETIDNVSGKLESFSLSDAIETSLNMQGMHAPVEEPRRGGLVHPLMIHKVQN